MEQEDIPSKSVDHKKLGNIAGGRGLDFQLFLKKRNCLKEIQGNLTVTIAGYCT